MTTPTPLPARQSPNATPPGSPSNASAPHATPTRTSTRRDAFFDWGIFTLLTVGYCAWLLSTVHNLGYARDEGFYFQAADAYLKWFKLLWEDPAAALERQNIDRYWRVNSEHPALIKSLFALSKAAFWDGIRLFPDRGTSYRFVGMAMSALTVATVYLWGVRHLWSYGRYLARVGGLVAALSLALMPRVFYHSHLDCFDMPVVAMGVFTTYTYWRALQTRTWGWAIVTALLYGLMLNTKHNAWLLPFALVGHLLWTQSADLLLGLRKGRLRIPAVLLLMATLGPLVFYALWPWIWHDTIDRLEQYVVFHTRHVYYNMEYLGQTYFEPPFPRSYAWIMTATTVPAITLALFAAGVLVYARHEISERILPWLRTWRSSGFWSSLGSAPSNDNETRQRQSTASLWLMCLGVHYAPWWFDDSPIFGGTKHWMPAYPYMVLFAGYATVVLSRAIILAWRERLPKLSAKTWAAVPIALALSVLIGPLVMTVQSHPWGLGSYTPIVGGAGGAASAGLNRSFWGYTTGAIQEEINEHAEKNARVFIHDTAMQSWSMLERDKRVRKDLRPQLGIAGSDLAIYHHEQHMARVEYMIWVDYGTTRPVHVGTYDGVPVVWLYSRP